MFSLPEYELTRVSRALDGIGAKIGRRRPREMDNHHDAQVEAFITAINRCGGNGHADVQYAGNGEFIIDGVVNVRAALDAANAVERDGSAMGTSGGDHG